MQAIYAAVPSVLLADAFTSWSCHFWAARAVDAGVAVMLDTAVELGQMLSTIEPPDTEPTPTHSLNHNLLFNEFEYDTRCSEWTVLSEGSACTLTEFS